MHLPLTVALLHHPVKNRLGEEITATVDHFDVFDASRLSLTYPIRRLYVVNHVPAQRALVERLIRHGLDDDRPAELRGTFAKTVWAPDLDAVVLEHEEDLGQRPTLVATSATPTRDLTTFATARNRLHGGEPMLLLVGKAWGLADRVFDQADLRLEPIDAGTGYNHLSVRSALAILLDRLAVPPHAR